MGTLQVHNSNLCKFDTFQVFFLLWPMSNIQNKYNTKNKNYIHMYLPKYFIFQIKSLLYIFNYHEGILIMFFWCIKI